MMEYAFSQARQNLAAVLEQAARDGEVRIRCRDGRTFALRPQRDAEPAVKAWVAEAEAANWRAPEDIRRRYRSADFLAGNRVVFNIRGNRYRLIVKIHYNTGFVFIRFVGTHEAYAGIDTETVNPKVLKTEAEYEAALAQMAALMDAEPGSPDEDALELWGLLIEQYEQARYPIDPPDPVDAILFRMEQAGLKPKDLIPYIGSQSKVSEVLNRKRRLSLTMIRDLSDGLGIPADVLLQPAAPAPRKARPAQPYARAE